MNPYFILTIIVTFVLIGLCIFLYKKNGKNFLKVLGIIIFGSGLITSGALINDISNPTINISNYLTFSDPWIIDFIVNGTEDLTVTPFNGTLFGEDIDFTSLKCGDNIIEPSIITGEYVLFEGYYCFSESHFEVDVLTSGVHTLMFGFGGSVAYAYNNAIIKEPNWVSPPNCVNNGSDCVAYIVHNITQPKNGYWVENFYGDNYFFDDYTIAKDHKTNNTLIEDVRWEIEYFQNKWRTLDLWDKSIEINDSNPSELLVKRISTDGTSTLTETYHYSKGTPKIDLNFTTSETELYRLVWVSTGIAGTKTREYKVWEHEHNKTKLEINLNEDFTIINKTSYKLEFTDDFTERFLVSLGWRDVFNSTTNETSFIRADWWAGSNKLDVYFGNFTGSFCLDPDWASPSSVEDCDGSSGPDVCSNTIDGDYETLWYHYTEVEHWIIYNLGSSQTVDQIRLNIRDPEADWGSPCKLTAIYVCNDNVCSGESSLGTCTFTGSGAGNYTCDITDTTGQWIKLKLNTYDVPGCGEYSLDWFYEFWYLPGEVGDDTDPIATSLSPINTANLTSTTVSFGLKCVDETGVSTAAVYGNFTGTWAVNETNSSIINNTVWNVTINMPSDGTYKWAAWCNDTSGNTDYSDVNWTFTVTTGVADTNFTIWDGSNWVDAWDSGEYIEFRCTPSQSDCEPTNQDAGSSQSIYQVCNNGTVAGTAVYMNVNQTFANIILECDDDYTVAGATTLTTNNQTIHGALAVDACVYISCWADYSNPTSGGYYDLYAYVN